MVMHGIEVKVASEHILAWKKHPSSSISGAEEGEQDSQYGGPEPYVYSKAAFAKCYKNVGSLIYMHIKLKWDHDLIWA